MKEWHIVPILTYSTHKKKKKKVKDKRCTIVFFLMYLLWLCAV